MDPDHRVDLFISCHDSDNLSAGLTAGKLASETAKAVRQRANNQGVNPFIFFESTTRQGEIADAVLQTRPGGLALFLLSPKFFSNWLCVAVLQAFLKVRSESNDNLKLRFVCLETSKEDILSSQSVKRQVPTLSEKERWTNIRVTSLQDTAVNLCDAVFGAWECSDGVLSQHDLPTILGETRFDSFLALQRVFTEDDLPTFRAVLSLPRDASNVLDAFSMASRRGIVTQYNVKKLYLVITYRNSPTTEGQRRTVEAYERKWMESSRLNWEVDYLEDLSRLFENKKGGPSQASSSSPHQKRIGKTDSEEISGMQAMKPQEIADAFKSYFDDPPQSGSPILDFESCDENGIPVTAEGLLLRKVLELANDNDCLTVAARGKQRSATCGMGGVGKTTALRALCYNEKVKKVYSDGICFLEFGQDADDQKVIEQVVRCVLEFGGEKLSLEMNESSSLSFVIKKGTSWLRGKNVLLVCDDLWSNGNEHGYLPDLSKLLRDAPRSGLLISTRNRKIAKSTGVSVEFAPLDAEGDKARKILLADVSGIGSEDVIYDKSAEDGIRRILRVCAGLPLALAIAGGWLETSVSDCRSISNGILQYCKSLEQDIDCIMTEGLEHYPGLAQVIKSSLKHCQEWGMSDDVKQSYKRKFDMTSMFQALCVLEKQMSLPKRALMHLWETDDKCTEKVMSKFADCNLASRVATGLPTQKEYGLRLHDLVLERCQKMAGQELSNWHKRILVAYRKKLNNNRNCKEDEEAQEIAGQERRKWHERIADAFWKNLGYVTNCKEDVEAQQSLPWWDAEDDGYVLAHLSRHLALGGQARELEHLLCDIRWTMLRVKAGEWLSLKSDFDHLFEVDKHAESGMMRMYEVLEKSFPYARARRNDLPFYIFAHLSREEREEAHTARLLSSINRHFPKPWLRPVTSCVAAVKDSREEWREAFTSPVSDIIIDWSREWVFAATSSEIILWSTLDRCALWRIPEAARSLALSRDGSVLVSASSNHEIRRWNVESRAPIGEAMPGHKDHVNCVTLSEDGSLIVSGSDDKTVRRWNAHNGAPIGEPLKGHEDQVYCIALSQDGSMIVSGSKDSTIRRWDARSGTPIGEPMCGHEHYVMCVAMSADGKVIVSGSVDDTIRLWSAQSGDSIGEPLKGHSEVVYCVALSGDGSVIVSGSLDRTIRRWDARSGALIGHPFFGHESLVSCISVNGDGTVLTSGSFDSTMRRWNAQSHGRDSHVSAHCNTMSRDGKNVLSRSLDKSRSRWSSQSGVQIDDSLSGHSSTVYCVAGSIDGSVIVSGSLDSTILRWDARSGTPIGEPMRGHERSVRCIAVSADGNVIVSGSEDTTIRRWDAHNGAQIGKPLEGHEEEVICVALCDKGSLIVSCSSDSTIRRWDARNGKPIGEPMLGHERDFSCVAVSADGKVIASGSADNAVRLWDAQNGAPIGNPLEGHKGAVKCVALNGNLIVSGSCDRTIRRWDVRSGNPIGEPLRGHKKAVMFVAMSRDGKVIVSGSFDKTVRLWNAVSGSPISEPLCRREDIVEHVAVINESVSSQYCTPTNMECLALNFERQLYIFGLLNGRVSICDVVQ